MSPSAAPESETVELEEPKQHLLKRPPIDIEFTDLTYAVPQGRNGSKVILRSVSGLFKSGQLTAILGPSGAGKSTLLNVLAGYKSGDASGSIMINGQPRVLRTFHKMSRYIMQEDLLQPRLTVMESMMIAADLKLGYTVRRKQKVEMINEVLELLRLTKCKKTLTGCLSGGERKRVSIALELVNNPPVIFLDEPTTGLDDMSSSQCISLLKNLAHGGRTVICSIHTPSARLFSQFDHVYIVSEGQCVFQGRGEDIVPFLASLGLHCPKHYNPADFMIEVSSGEYGDHTERMMMAVDNGRCYRWNQTLRVQDANVEEIKLSREELHQLKHLYDFDSSGWLQFRILMYRTFLQHWREAGYILFKAVMHVFIGLIIGGLFYQMGNDGSKTIFNFGFCFVTIIIFMYIPMLPALLNFPEEVKLLKREHFNRWYGLNAYFFAATVSRIPIQIILGCIYIALAYVLTDQPLEWERGIKFCVICLMMGIISESLGLAIASRLNIVNGIFVGPALSVPFMLLSVYGLGTGSKLIPTLIRAAMYFSYLRYALEGLVASLYGQGRPTLYCPSTEIYCQLREPRALLKEVGMEDVNYWIDFCALIIFFFLFKIISYILLRSRLSSTQNFGALSYIGRLIKSHFSLSART
ncbi:ATP-binding cassette subfamily G member 4-like [Macrosteles quadrilineatus]|uniref:ATP-binding cassette subfamily G member 4-like n=1 Tax=Macrosteles quadrilineatus TaxID=74068 RepID=UPI0023E19C5F|nr:ATP-binding cassette subfamily G member 4-like [Macrosteles quadrilineatus]